MNSNTFYNLDSQLYMVEDDKADAGDYVESLSDIFSYKNVYYITNIDEMSNAILDESLLVKKKVFWIDINLGLGREKEGLEIIDYIKKSQKESLIIVHTANGDYKSRCIELGADYFFIKREPEKTMNSIKSIINEFLAKPSIETRILEYEAQIIDVDLAKGLVKLECYYNNSVVMGYVPIQNLSSVLISKIELGQHVIVTVEYGEKSSYSIVPIEKKEAEDTGNSVLLRPDDNDLLDSDFWLNKL